MDDNLPAYNYVHSNGVNVKLDNETDTDHLKLVNSVKIISKEIAQNFIEYLKNNYGF
jgi:hypothetical protein